MQTYIALTRKLSVVCIYTLLSQINQKFVANGFVLRFERFHQIHVSQLNLVFLISSVIDPAIVERGGGMSPGVWGRHQVHGKALVGIPRLRGYLGHFYELFYLYLTYYKIDKNTKIDLTCFSCSSTNYFLIKTKWGGSLFKFDNGIDQSNRVKLAGDGF